MVLLPRAEWLLEPWELLPDAKGSKDRRPRENRFVEISAPIERFVETSALCDSSGTKRPPRDEWFVETSAAIHGSKSIEPRLQTDLSEEVDPAVMDRPPRDELVDEASASNGSRPIERRL